MIGVGFRLGEATAVERTARDRLTFDAWGNRLTQAQYLDRERTLRQTIHGQLSMHSWVLRLPNNVVVASCETFRIPLMPDGVIEVIASVYVERPLRGVKMASRMIEALIESRREAGTDALLLFSEIGTELYARAGFKTLPAPMRTWPSANGASTPGEWLSFDDLAAALQWRREQRAERLDVNLSEHVVDWHLSRSRFYAETLDRPMAPHLGVRAGGVQLLWTPDFKNDILRILDATGPIGASIAPAIAAAQAEAAKLGLKRVELWDDTHSTLLSGGLQLDREDDIPMGIAFTPRGELWLGPVSRACWA